MSKKSVYLLGIFLTIILGSVLYYYLCCLPCSLKAAQDTTEVVDDTDSNATMHAFTVKDKEGDLNLFVDNNLNFKTSNFSILEPISTSVSDAVLSVRSYLEKDSLKTLGITGYYTSTESNTSAFPNLGLARANAAKNYFVSTGIPSKKIDTYGSLSDDWIADSENILHGPLSFDIKTHHPDSLSNNEAIIKMGEAIKANPLVLYFETGASTINPTMEQREKIANISKYIDKIDVAIIHIIGHTDNTGDEHSNIKLGQKRADFVKRYLVGNAIPESEIETKSEGPNSPIASNATEEGRAKNRRVVVTIN